MFAQFVYALLSFCAREFPAKYETGEPGKIIVEWTSYMCMASKIFDQINNIVGMKKFTEPTCYLCMEKLLTILKNLREKSVKLVKKIDIYGALQNKTTFHWFFLIINDPIMGWKG